MPVTYFEVLWPDGVRERCYSPSSVVRKVLAERAYSIRELVVVSREALHAASERVAEKYGFTCSSALDQLRLIEARAASFQPEDQVRVLGFSTPKVTS